MGQQIWTEADLSEVALSLEGQSPEAALRWAFQHFAQDDVALACSFGAEDVALVDMMTKLRPGAKAFYLDTNVLFPETYDVIAQIMATYNVTLVQYQPLITLAEQAAIHGEGLWSRDPDACCGIRKVEPLKRGLSSLKAWITGIRREQAPTRASAQLVEWDQKFGLVKINPLVAWTEQEVWNYILDHGVPYNVLHDQGYPSIGCMHCTRSVKSGEDPRAGRWSGFHKTECGLHK